MKASIASWSTNFEANSCETETLNMEVKSETKNMNEDNDDNNGIQEYEYIYECSSNDENNDAIDMSESSKGGTFLFTGKNDSELFPNEPVIPGNDSPTEKPEFPDCRDIKENSLIYGASVPKDEFSMGLKITMKKCSDGSCYRVTSSSSGIADSNTNARRKKKITRKFRNVNKIIQAKCDENTVEKTHCKQKLTVNNNGVKEKSAIFNCNKNHKSRKKSPSFTENLQLDNIVKEMPNDEVMLNSEASNEKEISSEIVQKEMKSIDNETRFMPRMDISLKHDNHYDETLGLEQAENKDIDMINRDSLNDQRSIIQFDISENIYSGVLAKLSVGEKSDIKSYGENKISMKHEGPVMKKRHVCEICEKSFKRAPDLRRHLRIHSNEHRKHICHVCSKAFRERYHLKRHLLRKHQEDIPKPFQCGICGLAFVDDWHLERHMHVHGSGNPFHCGICGKNFAAKRNLELHVSTIHLQLKPFECQNCKKTFARKHHLDRHVLIHSGEKSFQCEFCGKAFVTDSNRISHTQRVHIGEKKYKCGLCDKPFFCTKSLKYHMQTHSGERQHSCNVCGKRFIEKRILQAHLYLHTDERPFSCKVCGKGYTTAAHLRRHQQEGICFGPDVSNIRLKESRPRKRK